MTSSGNLYDARAHTHTHTHILTHTHTHTHTALCEPACCLASVVVDSLQTLWTIPTRLLSPWDSPGKNMGEGYHALLQGYL